MRPGIEYIRVFKKNVLSELATYVYISENYLIQSFQEEVAVPNVDEYKWAIGWWKSVPAHNYAKDIADHKDDLMVKEDVVFDDCQCFIAQFATDHNIKIQTSGAVSIETFGYDAQKAPYPMFGNQLPVDIDINDISVPGSRSWEEDSYWDCVFMRPGIEYIRIFNTDKLTEKATYVYISENYLVQMFQEEVAEPDVSAYAWAIGWWKSVPAHNYAKDIADHKDDLMVKEPVTIKAGTGFIGQFATDHNLIFNFPSAIELPSNAK